MNDQFAASLFAEIRPLVARLVRDEVGRAVDERLPRWVPVRQAAERIGITESGVRERLRQGRLEGRKWDGRWYVSAAALDEAIDRDGYDPRRSTSNGAARLEPPAPGHKE